MLRCDGPDFVFSLYHLVALHKAEDRAPGLVESLLCYNFLYGVSSLGCMCVFKVFAESLPMDYNY